MAEFLSNKRGKRENNSQSSGGTDTAVTFQFRFHGIFIAIGRITHFEIQRLVIVGFDLIDLLTTNQIGIIGKSRAGDRLNSFSKRRFLDGAGVM